MSTQHSRVDRMFDVLSDRHRRRLLVVLDEAEIDAVHDFDALSEAVATGEKEARVRLRLVHCHLPKLVEFGCIRWDEDDGTVQKGPEWSTLEPLLHLLVDHRSELPDGYL